jgi:hypothetical protein
MPRTASTSRQSDLAHAVEGALMAGVKIVGVETDKRGKIILVAENGDRQSVEDRLSDYIAQAT